MGRKNTVAKKNRGGKGFVTTKRSKQFRGEYNRIASDGKCAWTGKVRFADEWSAQRNLRRAQLKHSQKADGHVEIRYYPCEHCDAFHLTSMESY